MYVLRRHNVSRFKCGDVVDFGMIPKAFLHV